MNEQKDNNEKVGEKDKPTKKKEEAPPPPPKKIRWMTRAMAEDFTREDILFTTFREAILYFVFVFSVTMFIIGRKTPVMFAMTQALEDQFLNREFETTNGVGIIYEDIRSVTDFWHYLETLLVSSLYSEHFYNDVDPIAEADEDDKKILFENELLGVPRIRQVKVKNDSCIIHNYFRRLFLTCYDLYRPADEDFEPFGLGNGTAWVFNTADETLSEPYTGRISTYEGGGFYQDLATRSNETLEMLENLRENLWIRRGTRAVFIDFSTYNMNVDLFCICKLVFEFPPTGGVVPSHSFRTLRLPYYIEFRYLDIFEFITYAIAFYFLIEEIREIMYFKLRYLLQFWTYIDVTIVAMALANFFIFVAILNKSKLRARLVLIQANPEKYGNMEYVGDVTGLYNNFNASLLFFSYIKIFKYLNFNKTMGQLNNTLKRCALDIFGFSIMFFIIFFAFAELGYLLFGSQVEDFSSFGVAMFTLLRTILGDFNYQAIEQANRVLAPIYFLSYIFFVFFVLLNMFLAIINDTYADVKTEIAIAPEEMQMTDFLKKSFHNLLQKCGCKIKIFEQDKAEFKATMQQIQDALKKCGFSEAEIALFFASYNIDIHADVADYDIKKILTELEGQTDAQEKLKDDTTPVNVRDFLTQQNKLERIERAIQQLGVKVDSLLSMLQSLEKARKPKN